MEPRIVIVKNFLTPDEINVLNDWAIEGVKKGWLDFGVSRGRAKAYKRLTSRMYAHRYQHSEVIKQISEKVRSCSGVAKYPLIAGHGKNGIVVSYTLPGGNVFRHKDSRAPDGMPTLRCNVLTQKAEAGGALYVEGRKVDIEVGDLHCYLVSEHDHWTTEVEGNTPRIMWMFGAHVPADDWNNETIKVNNGIS